MILRTLFLKCGTLIESEIRRDVPQHVTAVTLKPSISGLRDSIQFVSKTSSTAPNGDNMPTSSSCEDFDPPLYKVTSPQCNYYAVRIPLLKAGLRRVHEHEEVDCNVIWTRPVKPMKVIEETAKRLELKKPETPEEDMALARDLHINMLERRNRPVYESQRINHFPGSYLELGCKVGMQRNIARMQQRYPKSTFQIAPRTWNIPEETERFLFDVSNGGMLESLIVKPSRGSCGRGIFVTTPTDERLRSILKGTSPYVIQEYIQNPLLIHNLKFDMRIYVAVTSYDPLVVYRFQEGLVRFAAEEYPQAPLTNRFAQLTNFSVGRHYTKYLSNMLSEVTPVAPEDIPSNLRPNLKWTFAQLKEYFSSVNIDSKKVWNDIDDVIVKMLLCSREKMLHHLKVESPAFSRSSFELYGFDVLLDDTLRPWLLEVNVSPSLESSSKMDYETKTSVVTDLMNMLLLKPYLTNEDELKTTQGMLSRVRDEYHYRGGYERIFPEVNRVDSCGMFLGKESVHDENLWRSLVCKR
eukprot:PhF_6_TR25679/c0_g1_i1/m.36184/K16601/TTLL4; tubulin polyglutamylase TTLL4